MFMAIRIHNYYPANEETCCGVRPNRNRVALALRRALTGWRWLETEQKTEITCDMCNCSHFTYSLRLLLIFTVVFSAGTRNDLECSALGPSNKVGAAH